MEHIMDVEHKRAFNTIRDRMDTETKGVVSRSDAISFLEACAALAKHRTYSVDVTYDLLARVLDSLWDHPIDWQSRNDVQAKVSDMAVLERIRLARGLEIYLGEGKRLVAVTLRPGKFVEGQRLMKIVGIGHDTVMDVAERHDDYLVDAYMNAGKRGGI
jgi:hypothetical protein